MAVASMLRRMAVATGLVVSVAGALAIYATVEPRDNRSAHTGGDGALELTAYAIPAALAQAAGRNPLSTGDMATFVFKPTPEPLPSVAFTDASGAAKSLADWKGRVVLLNLWATWCGPCRKEMPQLDALQKELGSDRFEVVALSVDRTGVAGAKRFLEQIKTERLAIYADATARAGAALKAIGMPTTLLIDKEGREIGRLVGPAEWDGEDAKRLIRSVLQQQG